MTVPRNAPTSPFWTRLTELPRFAGLTQTGVAKLVQDITGESYGQTAVQKWKAGNGLPTLQTVIDIAQSENVCVEWLLTGRGAKTPSDLKDPQLAEILGLWRYLSPEARAKIVGEVKLARTLQFTGDPAKRSKYQRDLVRVTESLRDLEQSIRDQGEGSSR